ncbi:MAG TPA: hypothetical protein PLJ25_07545 [Methanothrix sp.]|nr:hypothetical protein [Methanothrix sp.]
MTLTFFAPEVTPEVLKMLRAFDGDLLRRELQLRLGLKDGEYFRKAYLQPALKGHLIEMTLPEKPRSSKQRYRLTKRGKASLETRR